MKYTKRISEIKEKIQERKKAKDYISVKYWQIILFKLELKNICNN